MEKRRVGGATVNDGKGLYDNDGILETIILDCNNAVKHLASGNYIAFCNLMVSITQKVTNVRKGIRAEMDEKIRHIEELKAMNNRLFEQVSGLPVENDDSKGGGKIGE